MALIEALDETRLANMALARVGAKRIEDIEATTDTSVEFLHIRTHFVQTRRALIRSHFWAFARGRETLSANATDPEFEWDNAYDLPPDCLRVRSPFDSDSPKRVSRYSYDVEGRQILSNESEMEIRYMADVPDPTQWDTLFVEVFVSTLALKIVMPLSGDRLLRTEIHNELYGEPGKPGVMAKVRQIDKQETNTLGRADRPTWNDARLIGGGDPMRQMS